MKKEYKIIIAVVFGLITLYFIITKVVLQERKSPMSDWTFEVIEEEIDDITESTEDDSLQYAVIISDKETVSAMDAHTFIEYIKTGLKKTENDLWAVFSFEDGTGIFFSTAELEGSAYYGTLNEKYELDRIYGVLKINNSLVTYDDSAYKNVAYDFADLIPEEYFNDTTNVMLEDSVLAVSLMVSKDELEVANQMQEIFESANNFNEITAIKYSINNKIYLWDRENGLVESSNINIITNGVPTEIETEEETEIETEIEE